MGLRDNTEKENFVYSSYILMMGYLVSSVISLIGTVITIRLISVEEYSLLQISYGIPAILIVLGELGLNYASTYFIAKNIKENNLKVVKAVIKLNLLIKTLIGLAFSILVISFSVYIAKEIYKINDERMVILIQIGAIGIIANILFDALNSIYLGALNVKMVQMGTILRTSLTTLLSVILILLGFSYLGPMIGFVLAPLIVSIIYILFLGKTFRSNNIGDAPIYKDVFLKMVNYGYPLLFFSIIASIQIPLYIYILVISGYILEVGYLNIALISSSIIGILTKSLSFTLFPIFSKMNWNDERERKKLVNYFQFSIKFGTIMILPITFLIILFSENLFPIIYGEKYRPATPFISGFFLIFLLVTVGSLSIPAFLNGQKRTRCVFYIQLVQLITSILFSLIFINLFGGIGIVYGIVVGNIISVAYGNLITRKIFGTKLFSNLRNISNIFLIAIITAIITFLIHYSLVMFISAEGVFFNLILFVIISAIYGGIFMLLIGFFSQISIYEIDLIIKGTEKFPLINKIVFHLAEVEKKIVRLRTKEK